MKSIARLIIILLLIGAILFAGVTVYLRYFGKDLLQNKLTETFQRKIEVGSLYYRFPFGCAAYNIRVENLGQVRKIKALFSLGSLFKKEVEVNYLSFTNPLIVVKKKKILSDEQELPQTGENFVHPKSPQGTTDTDGFLNAIMPQDVSIRIKNLFIYDGSIHFKGYAQSGSSFQLDEVYLKAGNIFLPLKNVFTTYELHAQVSAGNTKISASNLESRGWVNLQKKDLENTLEIIDAEGNAGLKASMIANNNDMTVEGEVRAQDLLLALQGQEEASTSMSANELIFSALNSLGLDMEARFSFETKMDDFKIENIAFSGDFITQ